MKYWRKLSCLFLAVGLLIGLMGCTREKEPAQPHGMVYFTYFDTVSYVYSYAGDSQKAFDENCGEIAAILEKYHHLFDIYHEYSGVNNLCTLNRQAGGEWLEVDKALIDFLLYAKDLYTRTGGEMNIMMGSVLRLWHNCREAASANPAEASRPTDDALAAANAHTSIDLLEIDVERGAIRITDPQASVDVGALGKGYATEMAAHYLQEQGLDGYVLNIGGNIRINGEKPDGSGWLTGIRNPAASDTYALYLTLADTSCVTSGNYERYFTVDGVRYHHIIDKDTLMPATYFASVTVITPDSGLADALSTALFCMSYEDGLALVGQFENVDVLWILPDGTQHKTTGLDALVTE